MFNVESSDELRAIDDVAAEMRTRARVALRVNPDVDPKTHPYISTGMKKSKFGISADRALEEFKLASSLKHIDVAGVHKHIGSQLTDIAPFVDALKKVLELVEQLKEQGIDIRYINVGGGLGITYSDETPPEPKDLAAAISPLLRDLKCTVIMEPGRVIVGNAGALVTKVLYQKASDVKRFVIVDAAMNDLIRPSLYGAFHDIKPVRETPAAKSVTVDVVGPVCESGDFLAKDRTMPEVKAGDLLAVMSAGAYGFVMASNYNSRPRVPEILVKGKEIHVIRERESLADLVRGEAIPAFLKSKAGTAGKKKRKK
jgi:diaminopimelate decarboxylase